MSSYVYETIVCIFHKIVLLWNEFQLFVDVTVTLNVDSSYSLFTEIFLHIRTN